MGKHSLFSQSQLLHLMQQLLGRAIGQGNAQVIANQTGLEERGRSLALVDA